MPAPTPNQNAQFLQVTLQQIEALKESDPITYEALKAIQVALNTNAGVLNAAVGPHRIVTKPDPNIYQPKGAVNFAAGNLAPAPPAGVGLPGGPPGTSVAPTWATSTLDGDGANKTFPFLVPITTLWLVHVGGQAIRPEDVSVVAGDLVLGAAVPAPESDEPVTAIYT